MPKRAARWGPIVAAGLLAGACDGKGTGSASAGSASPSAKLAGGILCGGVNACSAKSDCKTDKNECAGKNGCKGQGVVRMTEEECKGKGGTIQPSLM